MHVVLQARSPAVLVLPVRAGAVPANFLQAAGQAEFTGEPETWCGILGGENRVLLVGLGDGGDPLLWEAAGAVAASRLAAVPHITIDARGCIAQQAALLAAGAVLRSWRLEGLRTRDEQDAPKLAVLDLVSDAPDAAVAWDRQAAAIAGCVFARNLSAEPANTLTPAGFVQRLRRLAEAGIALEVLDKAALEKLGAGCLLAVGQGSAHPPCLAVLRWPGTMAQQPVAFVGKGITFDTGGISIKPADGMWDMKSDMAGAAACAGTMLALALRKSPAPAIAILAIAENTTGAASYRPGDVLRSLSGRTVQVVDTDAEGRLALADALTFALRQKPCAVIDLATLTGSMVVALGHHMAGFFGTDRSLSAALSAAGAATGERLWRMPIDESHRRALDSDIADIKHCVDGRGQPDACQAAAFLKEFVDAGCSEGGQVVPWAHLDIAGVDLRAEATPRHASGSTGYGVRLLDRLVAERFETLPLSEI